MLGGMDLTDVSLEVAINALIGSMLQNGYLDELQNSILVSVENDDANRSEQLRAKVASAINSCMSGDQLEGAVLSQTVSGSDDALKAQAEQYGADPGGSFPGRHAYICRSGGTLRKRDRADFQLQAADLRGNFGFPDGYGQHEGLYRQRGSACNRLWARGRFVGIRFADRSGI